MEVRLPKELAKLKTGSAGKSKFPISVIASFRLKLQLLEAASSETDIRNWKSLRYEKLLGDRKGQHSIRLNDQWRLIFELDGATTPATIKVVGIEDYH